MFAPGVLVGFLFSQSFLVYMTYVPDNWIDIVGLQLIVTGKCYSWTYLCKEQSWLERERERDYLRLLMCYLLFVPFSLPHVSSRGCVTEQRAEQERLQALTKDRERPMGTRL